MSYIATFDLGTTAIKCVVLDDNRRIVYKNAKEITTYNDGFFIEQNPKEWFNVFSELSQSLFKELGDDAKILGIILSGQMQDLICVDREGNSLTNAILYSDQRGEDQMSKIPCEIRESIIKKTGNDLNGAIPLTKLLWIREHNSKLYNEINKILISAKDYINTKLTGTNTSDVTSLATSGMMDIKSKKYICEIEQLGIDKSILPKICYADEIVGYVTVEAEKLTGFKTGTNVYGGTGDAGATTLASGISKVGEININLGTSGWIASISKDVLPGVFNLAAVNRGMYINVIPISNAGSVHKWIANVIDGTAKKYISVDNAIKNTLPNAGGLFFLPYLVGERFPVLDANIRGCYIGVNANTTKDDIVRSTLEGVAFSMKQGLIALGIAPTKVSLIGGGARESEWNQIFADVLGSDVTLYENSEFLPSMALASSVLLDQGILNSYEEFITSLMASTKITIHKYDETRNRIYQKAYTKFEKIYPTVKSLFEE